MTFGRLIKFPRHLINRVSRKRRRKRYIKVRAIVLRLIYTGSGGPDIRWSFASKMKCEIYDVAVISSEVGAIRQLLSTARDPASRFAWLEFRGVA